MEIATLCLPCQLSCLLLVVFVMSPLHVPHAGMGHRTSADMSCLCRLFTPGHRPRIVGQLVNPAVHDILTLFRQIFPTSAESMCLPSKNSALARIHQKRVEIKANAGAAAAPVSGVDGSSTQA
jgi:hypothetical protein